MSACELGPLPHTNPFGANLIAAPNSRLMHRKLTASHVKFYVYLDNVENYVMWTNIYCILSPTEEVFSACYV